jgi:hypothetical protein
MSATITLNTLEGLSYSILADTSQTIVTVAKDSRFAVKHYHIIRHLKSINTKMRELVSILHTPESIRVLESIPTEQLATLAELMREVPIKTVEMIGQIRSLPLGYWVRFYRPHLLALEASNSELYAHVTAFTSADLRPILLTKEEQAELVASLLNPGKPNGTLRRAFSR